VAVLDAMLATYPDLPRIPAELHRLTVDVDVGGWFRREGGAVVLAHGKHRGRTLDEVVASDAGYLRWLRDQALFDDARRLIKRAIREDAS
jgi:hypothetical protein